MFAVFVILLAGCCGTFYILQGVKVIPMKIKENEPQEKYVTRLNQKKLSGVILILIGLLYAYQLVQAGL
jgi:hypothetical protein